MGPETTQYRDRIIKIAKASYLDAFISSFPEKKDYTIDRNVYVSKGKNIDEFSLMITNQWGSGLIERSFKFSDF